MYHWYIVILLDITKIQNFDKGILTFQWFWVRQSKFNLKKH